jgi:hypothetical protein
MNTLAWTRYITCTQAKFLPDGNGNTYLIYAVPDINTGTDVSYIRYDASGNATASHFLFFRASTNLELDGVWLSPSSAPAISLYVSCGEALGGGAFGTVVTKSDLAGNQVWQANYNTATNFFPVGGSVDSSDNFWLAMQKGATAETSGLEMVEIDPTGTVLLDHSNTNVAPDTAVFIKGKWCVTGLDVTSAHPDSSVRWGMYDPATGNYSNGVVFDYLDNGTDNYGYGTLSTYVDPAGAIDIGVTVYEYRDSDQAFIAQKHFVRRYNLTGSLQWISPSYDGAMGNLLSFGTNGAFFNVYPGFHSPLVLEGFDHLGQKQWSAGDPSSQYGWPAVNDATGIFTFSEDPSNYRRLILSRYDVGGNMVWSAGVSTAAGTSGNNAELVDANDSNNNLYTAVSLPVTSTTRQVSVQRYVSGVALSTITDSSPSVMGGATETIKVQLNAPAPAGGLLVKMTSNSTKALFPNNATAYNLAISAGSLYATVAVHTSAVIANTPVTILGNQSGVQRSVGFTVTE